MQHYAMAKATFLAFSNLAPYLCSQQTQPVPGGGGRFLNFVYFVRGTKRYSASTAQLLHYKTTYEVSQAYISNEPIGKGKFRLGSGDPSSR